MLSINDFNDLIRITANGHPSVLLMAGPDRASVRNSNPVRHNIKGGWVRLSFSQGD